jgi:hypothetical protein
MDRKEWETEAHLMANGLFIKKENPAGVNLTGPLSNQKPLYLTKILFIDL